MAARKGKNKSGTYSSACESWGKMEGCQKVANGGAYAATTNDAHIHRRTGAAGYRHRLPSDIRLDAMKLTLKLTTDETIALFHFANEISEDLDAAAQIALRDWLIGQGLLKLPHELDEDTETVGSA